MRNLHRLFLLSLSLFVMKGDLPCYAQQGDDGGLYFPPEFTLALQSGPRGKAEEGLICQEFLFIDRAPLLPIMFFEAGEIQPPKRYRLFFNSLEADSIADVDGPRGLQAAGEIAMHWQLLNIIGSRMRALAGTTIELEPGYSTEPGEKAEIAVGRAEFIREYLVNIWKIEPERIGLLPPHRMCDSVDNIFKREEAQCVLIHPNDIALVDEVIFHGMGVSLPAINLSLTVQPNTGDPSDVASVEIVIQTGDTVLSRTDVEGHPDSALYRLQGMWSGNRDLLATLNELEVYAMVHLHDGSTRRANSRFLPVRKEQTVIPESNPVADGRLDGNTFEIRLPFFFHNREELSPLQQNMLADAVQSILGDTLLSAATLDLSIHPGAEASEDTSSDNALLYSLWSEHRILSNRIESLSRKLPEIRPLLLQTPETLANRDPGRFDAWYYGDEAKSIPEESKRRSALAKSDLSNEGKRLIDSLSMRRGEKVANSLRRDAEETKFGEVRIVLHSDQDDKPRQAPPYCFTPEERFYQRHVLITGVVHRDEDPYRTVRDE